MTLAIETLDWEKGSGLIPAIVQDALSLRVLMLGYMNQEALRATQETGLVTFFSRSKNRLWQKGESSGNVLRLCAIKTDCDSDALLVRALPAGPTCHTGATSCFGEEDTPTLAVLADVQKVIQARKKHPEEGSYTSALFKEGLARIAQKVGEEGVEVALAGALGQDTLEEEAADLLYHLLVLLAARGKSLEDPLRVLLKRRSARP